MLSTRALVVSGLGSLVSLAFLGCSEPEPTTNGDSNVLASVETSVRPQYSPPLTGGTCPPSSEPPQPYQQHATAIFGYIVGGNDPITKEEMDANSACIKAHDCTTTLRDYLMNGKYVTLNPASTGKVCGLQSLLYSIDVSPQIAASLWDSMKTCGDYLDGCYGVGVSGFYYADPTQDKNRRIYIDPEPAVLVEDLYGSTGATAGAVYENSGTKTSVIKWPSTYVNVTYPPLAGTPCSTGDLPWGAEATRVIQAAGSFRRCY